MEVVKGIEEPELQITLQDAKKIRKDVELWEKLLINVTPASLELSRIAAQAAAQTIKQNLKNIERERFTKNSKTNNESFWKQK